jgi:fission process protein 1
VNTTYAIAGGYCIADVAYEAYKVKRRGNKSENGEPMTVTQVVVERSVFQLFASIALPFAIIHTTVDVAKKVFTKMNKYQKWGPSIVGLSIIPLLPICCDEPVEHALEWAFSQYGPWAHKDSKHEKKD